MSGRSFYIFGLCLITLLLTTGFYIEYAEGFEPCPLCTLQRLCFMLLGCLFFLGIFLYRICFLAFFVNFLLTATATCGTLLAGRQMWLQTLPASGECSMSFHYMLATYPLNEMFTNIIHGSADCAERGWELFSLNLAEWSFISFCFLTLFSLFLWTREQK